MVNMDQRDYETVIRIILRRTILWHASELREEGVEQDLEKTVNSEILFGILNHTPLYNRPTLPCSHEYVNQKTDIAYTDPSSAIIFRKLPTS
jgi:hypothetical protein